jgi:hypothetical protein
MRFILLSQNPKAPINYCRLQAGNLKFDFKLERVRSLAVPIPCDIPTPCQHSHMHIETQSKAKQDGLDSCMCHPLRGQLTFKQGTA